ncbi:hypothetical protein SPF06_01005 [Sinomonas sp. JGH33]|uniref:Uncharacterized protein n=1 Tax=Sinomonas terricola TaxID=3110330 RepID=A0ABU5T0V9_9MICC|nr:hypothetical protein [Sinomonas sp. JGH33]MEA5453289.1 hypothetical protein [Sinomonas sp. JGH33]
MITETCGCGASIQYPAKHGHRHAREWRDTHAHQPKSEAHFQHEEMRAEVGFCLPRRDEEDE